MDRSYEIVARQWRGQDRLRRNEPGGYPTSQRDLFAGNNAPTGAYAMRVIRRIATQAAPLLRKAAATGYTASGNFAVFPIIMQDRLDHLQVLRRSGVHRAVPTVQDTSLSIK
ncbi:hypothetical protein [Nitrosococcus oceani]|uniref:hypothetical protein n=1 Tax=Nitrosococcus oceani TaxID=1229 RepID=UPI001E3966A2|nr:hypothetical protein [Nitrosococcus oceani]